MGAKSNISALYGIVKRSGRSPDAETISRLYVGLDDEHRRAIFYKIVEHIRAGFTQKVVEFPRFGPQGELFK